MVNYISFFWTAIFLAGCAYLLRFRMQRPVVPFIAFGGAIVHGVAILVGGGWQGFVELGSGVVLMILGFYTINRRAVREVHYTDLSHHRAA